MNSSDNWLARSQHFAPGIILTALVACLSFGLRYAPGVSVFSPLIIAIVIGIMFHNIIGLPDRCKPGVNFTLKKILKFGIILLGLQLTLGQVLTLGITGTAIIIITAALCFMFTTWLGKILKVDPDLTQLVAAGTSICGASAVIAANTVTNAPDEDVAYAIACVTVFGTLSMFLFPLMETILKLGPHAYGLWSGATIHEVAQVVAAAFQQGEEAGSYGTIAKLTRVMLLAPLVILIGALASRKVKSTDATGQAAKIPFPWFVMGFLVMVGIASFNILPESVTKQTAILTQFLLAMALAAMGLETDVRKLKSKGMRPALLGASSWVFIISIGLALILIFYGGKI